MLTTASAIAAAFRRRKCSPERAASPLLPFDVNGVMPLATCRQRSTEAVVMEHVGKWATVVQAAVCNVQFCERQTVRGFSDGSGDRHGFVQVWLKAPAMSQGELRIRPAHALLGTMPS